MSTRSPYFFRTSIVIPFLLLLVMGVDANNYVFGVDGSKVAYAVYALILLGVISLKITKPITTIPSIFLKIWLFFISSAFASGYANASLNLAFVEIKSWTLQFIYIATFILVVRNFKLTKTAVILAYLTNLFICLSQATLGMPYLTNRIFDHSFLPIQRVQGIMDDPNYYAAYFGALTFLLIPMIQKRRNIAVILIISFVIIIMTGSRAILLSYILVLCIWFIMRSDPKILITKLSFTRYIFRLKVWIYFSVFLLLGYSLIITAVLPKELTMLFDVSNYNMSAERSSLVNRFYVQSFAISESVNKPFFGHGPRTLPINVEVKGENKAFGGNSHNSYIEILYSYGYPFLVLYLFTLWILNKTISQLSNDSERMFGFLAFIFFCVVNFFLVNYFSRITALLICVCWYNYNLSNTRQNYWIKKSMNEV